MLDESKARNDMLSQAYAALHSEYVQLKASQDLEDQQAAVAAAAAVAAYRPSDHLGGAFDRAGMALVSGPGAADDILDMDLFAYQDVGHIPGYAMT
jgi:AP-1-like factor